MSMQWNHDECWQDERDDDLGQCRAAIAEAEAEAATQEWAAFEQDMQTAYPWPEGEIDPFEPRQAA